MNWIDRGALKQAWALRVAVMCLGAAVLLLPLPFLALSARTAAAVILAVALIVFAYLIYEGYAFFRAAAKARELARGSSSDGPTLPVPAPDTPPGKRT